ncbi:hypothetical protein [Vreelandella venusta]|uniref:hypothetical protein n=1 Tax=Vreelandella venusta TaxID=44935 RepID=UPI00200D8FC3|nr:hypothetical protein [Halomonas venusta]UQI42713.1 hypothetical protein M3L73_10805 [Halomonas venusta]
MNRWKITGPPRFCEHVGMVYPVTKGGSRFNAAEEDELKALLANAEAVREALSNIVGLAKLGAAPLHQYEAAIKHAEQVLSK